MWVFSKDAEEGLEFFKQDLKHLSTKHSGVKFGYLPLLRVILVCAVARASLYFGAWIVHYTMGGGEYVLHGRNFKFS